MNQTTALKILKTGANVFLTGEPGSGKTHTVNQYVCYLRERGIEPAVTASTGIAATHLGGMTIHSWSGIGIKSELSRYDLDKIATTEYIVKRIRQTNVLIIDEVSMLSPETLSMIDLVCREVKGNDDTFGGLQVIFVGDFFQLPPVVKKNSRDREQVGLWEEEQPRFAYNSSAWLRAKPVVCYLTEQYRQDDGNFLSLLSNIRSNSFSDLHLQYVFSRKTEIGLVPEGVPKLFSHNLDVDRVNEKELQKLPSDRYDFLAEKKGSRALVAVLQKGCLSPEVLSLKKGAVVIFTKNNQRAGFVNGTLGEVESFESYTRNPIVRTRDGRRIEVEPMEWTVEEGGRIRASITQHPLRLAWAITVHKSQGMSLDEAVVDLSGVFEYGQGYVALSRVRRLSGLYILGWNEMTFQVHPEVLSTDESFRLDSVAMEKAFADMPEDQLERMQDNFVKICGGGLVISKKNKIKPKKGGTYTETLRLWNEGKNIPEIAKERGYSEGTIFSHIEKLIEKNKIDRSDLKRLITSDFARVLPDIQAVFRELDTDKLSLVFEEFRGKYSYDELRLARMME